VAVYRRVLFESSTGFVTFGTRSYNPAWERLTQQDPVGGSLGDLNAANRYTYANDDPVNAVDPSGQACIYVVLAASLGLLAAALGALAFFVPITAPIAVPLGIIAGLLAAYYGLVSVFLC